MSSGAYHEGEPKAIYEAGEKYRKRCMWAMMSIDKWVGELTMDDVRIDSLTVRAPDIERGRTNYLSIVRGSVGNRKLVLFGSGESPEGAISNVIARLQGEGANWKDDRPFGS